MATYYVGAGGSDVASGLSYALRKLTLNGVEDIPVAAGDTVYVTPGVYRELLTCDVSGTAGNIITYIGDVTGTNTDGVGGAVRITGSDDDLTATRGSCITASAKDYRTFRGFSFDTTAAIIIQILTTSSHWVLEDFYCQSSSVNSAAIQVTAGSDVILRRGIVMGGRGIGIIFTNTLVIDNTANVVENVVIVGGGQAISTVRVGGVTVRNCLIFGGTGIRVTTALTVGQTLTVKNCLMLTNTTCFQATTTAEFVEDYNQLWAFSTSYTTVTPGANTITAPPLFATPQFLAGTSPDWQTFGLSQWSAARATADSGAATDDLYGITRPVTAAKRSLGPVQWVDQSRSSTQAHAGTYAMKLADAGRVQMLVPVSAVSTTISVYVYREASYAGTNPQLIVKQQGQADQSVTDAAAAGQWNLITLTFTPAAIPTWATVELVSNNTATGASIATYFDDLVST